MAALPWEYLYDPSNDRFFALSDQTPLVRYLDLPFSEKPLEVTRRLRGAGLVRRQQRAVVPRCPLYADFLLEHLNE